MEDVRSATHGLAVTLVRNSYQFHLPYVRGRSVFSQSGMRRYAWRDAAGHYPDGVSRLVLLRTYRFREEYRTMNEHAADSDAGIVGICGLYCGTCPSYLAPRLGDVDPIRERAVEWGLSEEEVTCDGCLSQHVAKPCQACVPGFRQCARKHSVTWCFECSEFPCERLYRFRDAHVVDGISHHAHVIHDLEYMRIHGVENWLVIHRQRQQCTTCGEINYWFSQTCRGCGAKIQ